MWSGKTSDGVLPDLFSGTRDAIPRDMRRDEDEDPKRPRPVRVHKKGSNPAEAAEAQPWHLRKDDERDRHRHV